MCRCAYTVDKVMVAFFDHRFVLPYVECTFVLHTCFITKSDDFFVFRITKLICFAFVMLLTGVSSNNNDQSRLNSKTFYAKQKLEKILIITHAFKRYKKKLTTYVIIIYTFVQILLDHSGSFLNCFFVDRLLISISTTYFCLQTSVWVDIINALFFINQLFFYLHF